MPSPQKLATSLFAIAFAIAIFAAAAAATPALAEGIFKNLKVLPKSTTRDEMKKIMKAQSAALGVECAHCHDEDDMSRDVPKKLAARSMMKMTTELNSKWFKKSESKVTCGTCHQGHAEPPRAP